MSVARDMTRRAGDEGPRGGARPEAGGEAPVASPAPGAGTAGGAGLSPGGGTGLRRNRGAAATRPGGPGHTGGREVAVLSPPSSSGSGAPCTAGSCGRPLPESAGSGWGGCRAVSGSGAGSERGFRPPWVPPGAQGPPQAPWGGIGAAPYPLGPVGRFGRPGLRGRSRSGAPLASWGWASPRAGALRGGTAEHGALPVKEGRAGHLPGCCVCRGLGSPEMGPVAGCCAL